MELYKAIKNIINLSGTNILKEQRFVNILADFSAYDDVPSAKFIIKTIIDEGYMDKFLANGKWDLNCDKLIDQFVAMTGMQKDNVTYVFECVGYAFNWLQNVHVPTNGNPIPTKNKTVGLNPLDKNAYMNSVTEVHNGQSLNNIILSNPTVNVIDANKIVVGCEVSGKMPRSTGYVEIHCAIYVNNCLYMSKEIECIFKSRYSGFCVASDTFDITVAMEDITRIVFYIN